MLAVADTHALLWYLYDDPRLSAPAREVFERAAHEGDTIGVSVISVVEVFYLAHRPRKVDPLAPDALRFVLAQVVDPDSFLELVDIDLNVVQHVIDLAGVPASDMPDRLILASAHARDVPIISKDNKIASSVREDHGRVLVIW